MKERKISTIYKLLVALSLLAGILLNVMNTTSVTAILSYYTLQSNIICFAMFVAIIVAIFLKEDYRSNNIYYLLKGAVIIAILVTAIIYQISLLPNNFNMEAIDTNNTAKYWANEFVHKISPVLVLMDYILFDDKGNFKYYYPVIWLFIPLNYVIYVYTYSTQGGRFYGVGGSKQFAYIFLDYNQIGYIGVMKSIVIIAILILLMSYFLVFLDRRQKRK